MIVREASREEARTWFAALHYTGTVGGCWFYAAEVDGETRAMVALGRGGNRFGVADKFGLLEFPGNIEITRVACATNAPRNTASASLAAVCKVVAAGGIDWLFSYSDTAQGHHGGIYQALGAIFVGTDAKQWVNFSADGKRVSKRYVSGRFGHTRWPEVQVLAAAEDVLLERVNWMPKLTYILPIAQDRKRRAAVRSAAQRHALPYPKRTDDLAGMATRYRNHRPAA